MLSAVAILTAGGGDGGALLRALPVPPEPASSTSSSSARSSSRRRSRSSPCSRSWCSTACYNSLFGLTLVYVAFQLPITIYILESFFSRIPNDLFEAARIDGYSEWSIFWRISLPIALPALSTTIILNTILLWNEFLYAVVLITDEDKRTLPLGIQRFMGDQMEDIGMISTGLMIAIIPVVMIYAFFSEKLIQGMTAGAVK